MVSRALLLGNFNAELVEAGNASITSSLFGVRLQGGKTCHVHVLKLFSSPEQRGSRFLWKGPVAQ